MRPAAGDVARLVLRTDWAGQVTQADVPGAFDGRDGAGQHGAGQHGAGQHGAGQPGEPDITALRRAQRRGDPAPGKDPAALAGFFVTFMNGLRVAAKTNPDERALIQRPEAALTVLD
jgi:hypothetical protein